MITFKSVKSRVIPGFFVLVVMCGMASGQVAPQNSRPVQVRLSEGVSKANLIKEVKPVYPDHLNVSGSVLMNVTVGKNGKIQRVLLVSGHPMLAPAAMDAVKQWKYKPYLLNGEPVEFETQVTVVFEIPQ